MIISYEINIFKDAMTLLNYAESSLLALFYIKTRKGNVDHYCV